MGYISRSLSFEKALADGASLENPPRLDVVDGLDYPIEFVLFVPPAFVRLSSRLS
jgi:hypothetical protein